MDDQRTDSLALRSIAWKDLCPWLMLFRAPGLALRMEVLFLATAGGILTALAWWASGLIFYFGSPVTALEDYANSYDTAAQRQQAENIAQLHRQLSRLPGAARTAADGSAPVEAVDTARRLQAPPFATFLWRAILGGEIGSEPFHNSWRTITRPWMELLSLRVSLRQFGYLLCGGLLTLFIWSIFGGAITRCASVQLARGERIGMGPSLKFAVGKLLSYFASPLMPLGGTALFALGVLLVVGLPMNLDAGLIWAGLVWILVLAFGLLIGVLLLGLLFGWPLMWATISTEGTDTFDALSRTYAYTMQRPLHYLLYVVLVGALGALTWLLVLGFGEAVIHLSWWAADWAVFDETRMEAIVAAADGDHARLDRLADEGVEISSLGHAGIWLFRLANGLVRAVAFSFAYGYFWVSASAIYLLLRRDVDHTETDEIFLDDESESYGLPPLKEDEAGVPTVDEPEKKESQPPSDSAEGPVAGDQRDGEEANGDGEPQA